MPEMVMLEYALELLSRGYLCVPVRRKSKLLDVEAMGYSPIEMQTLRKKVKELCYSSISFHLAQRPPSESTVESWFDGFDGNLGVVGGFGGLMVLDFDKVTAFERWRKENAELVLSTPVARSPNGYHVYLRVEEPTITTSMHCGLRRIGHVKGLGGYALGPPSVLRDGSSYHWLPQQSPLDVAIQTVQNLESLALLPESPLKKIHDRLRDKGRFDPS